MPEISFPSTSISKIFQGSLTGNWQIICFLNHLLKTPVLYLPQISLPVLLLPSLHQQPKMTNVCLVNKTLCNQTKKTTDLCYGSLMIQKCDKLYFVSIKLCDYFTATFNSMRTLKFKPQPTNAFFATINQMSDGSSQLPTTVERMVIPPCKSLITIQTKEQCSAVVGSWEEPPNISLAVAKNAFVS